MLGLAGSARAIAASDRDGSEWVLRGEVVGLEGDVVGLEGGGVMGVICVVCHMRDGSMRIASLDNVSNLNKLS